ncbi:hypothetical protein SUGI_0254060 [Cryptomeria japonica]|uniref:peroxiredoxin-2B-like n=1 Tax=Cryptomeria japonica TaxID=3369 RepID=UPI002408C212|nr:peroxiredoxin-2B-like [Cryptomeria japonica]GLJ15478.1 hypothetical protein SUGI_0254060 [Cryptomeria japonica]
MAPIVVGDKIPEGTLASITEDGNVKRVSLHSLATGKKIFVFGVPAAFTLSSTLQHVPDFVEKAKELKTRGMDDILLISANEPFLLREWGKTYPNNKHVKFLADLSEKYIQALGLSEDMLGIRSRRFALVCDNLEIKVVNIEGGGRFEISSADEI